MELLNDHLSSLGNGHRFFGFHNINSYGLNEILDDQTEDDEYHTNKSPFNHSASSSSSTPHGNNNFEKELQQCLAPLLVVGHYNKIDLAQLLMEQYQISNLSTVNKYISRSSLFDEMVSNRNINLAEKNKVKAMLTNYLQCYTKYIETPIPSNINEISSTFKPFKDRIDNILLYFSKLNYCVNQQKMIKARPVQFDVYFVPPSAPYVALNICI